jgi:predicted DNA-binding transcriptional regulator AlpA
VTTDSEDAVAPPKRVARYLSRSEVAEFLGLKGSPSLSRIVLPPHDAKIGKYKGWLKSTITEWDAARPGRGWWGPREK